MRVCVVAYKFYETSPRVSLFARAFAQRGDTVDVICLRREGQEASAVVGGVRLQRIQRRERNERLRLSHFLRGFRFFFHAALVMTAAEPYDLIYVFSVPDFLVFSAIAAKLRGARVILDVYDLLPEFYISKFTHGRPTAAFRILQLVEKASMSFSDYVIVSNDIWRARLESRSVSARKCATVSYHSDPQVFSPRPKTRTGKEFVFVYPGTLNRHQGVDIAIRAFARVSKLAAETRFEIYGEGPERESLEKLITDLRLVDRVFVRPQMPVEEVAALMANCDAGIVPKRASSCFGNEAASTKILDFMMLGLPVLASRTKVESQYFDGTELIFFESENEEDLANCMLRLIQDSRLGAGVVERAYQYLSSHSWAVARKGFFRIIDSVCERNLFPPEGRNRISGQAGFPG